MTTTSPLPQTDAGRIELTFTEVGNAQVATLLIDRADKLNALTLELLADLERCLIELATHPARVVVLRTGGTKAFCVGADITSFAQLSAPDMWRSWIAVGHRIFNQLAALPQPTVAVVDGIAVGGGLELALSCDLRVAGPDARFGLPENGIGTVPGWGGTDRLTRAVGIPRSKEMILTRRRIDAETALNWGLVNRVAAPEDLEAEVDKLVDELLGSAPIAQQVSKQLIDAGTGNHPTAILEALASGFTSYTDDFREGINSFAARVSPTFLGR
jgi:enoyl-CoA hydratase